VRYRRIQVKYRQDVQKMHASAEARPTLPLIQYVFTFYEKSNAEARTKERDDPTQTSYSLLFYFKWFIVGGRGARSPLNYYWFALSPFSIFFCVSLISYNSRHFVFQEKTNAKARNKGEATPPDFFASLDEDNDGVVNKKETRTYFERMAEMAQKAMGGKPRAPNGGEIIYICICIYICVICMCVCVCVHIHTLSESWKWRRKLWGGSQEHRMEVR